MAARARRRQRAARGNGTCFKRTVGQRVRWFCQISEQVGGKRQRTTFSGDTLAEAQAKRDAYKAAPAEQCKPVDKTQVAAFLESWLETKEAECATSTVHAYRWAVNEYIAPEIGERRLGDLDALDIDRLLNALRSKPCGPREEPASTRTLRAVYVTLRAALNFAVQRRLMAISPMNGIKSPKHRAKKITPLTREQARRFLKAAKDDRLYALYVLAITCGLRQAELFGLKWCDVDMRAGRLAVRRQVVEQGGGAAILVDHTKSGRDRSIKLPPQVIAVLREHQKRRFARGDIANELLFTAPRGGFLIKSNFLRKSFQPMLEKAQCPRVRFHDMRHTAATLAFEQGVHPKQVQEMLGHSSVALTLDIYSAFIPTMQDQVAEAMERALFG